METHIKTNENLQDALFDFFRFFKKSDYVICGDCILFTHDNPTLITVNDISMLLPEEGIEGVLRPSSMDSAVSNIKECFSWITEPEIHMTTDQSLIQERMQLFDRFLHTLLPDPFVKVYDLELTNDALSYWDVWFFSHIFLSENKGLFLTAGAAH